MLKLRKYAQILMLGRCRKAATFHPDVDPLARCGSGRPVQEFGPTVICPGWSLDQSIQSSISAVSFLLMERGVKTQYSSAFTKSIASCAFLKLSTDFIF